ncbi:MAG TPA: twin transmembrane helix small protein [Alphaproteobacteria bacterium]|nr:twin transmembrane helix small protein [Alphaproteobacteria bacterium]
MTVQLVLKILLIGAMLATVGALTIGLFNMSKEGKEAGERSNKMMRLRIIFQALAIVIFSILLFWKVQPAKQNLNPSFHSFVIEYKAWFS